jgi:hypothetical protein
MDKPHAATNASNSSTNGGSDDRISQTTQTSTTNEATHRR